MKLGLIVLCIGATSFLLRVLAALINELRFPAQARANADHARFDPHNKPDSERGDLIVMQPKVAADRVRAQAR